MTTPTLTPHRISAALLLALTSGGAAAEVKVRVGETSLAQDKPLQVTFEASGTSVASPDLTPLQADFDILNRSVQQRSSTINGRRTQWTSLSVLLRAKRSGNLEIPALRFGGETSRPQPVTILPGTEPIAGPPQGPGVQGRDLPLPWDPFGMQHPQFGAPMGSVGMDAPFAPFGGMPPAQLPALPPGSPLGDKAGPGSVAGGPLGAPLLETAPAAPPSEGGQAWNWIAGIAAAGWLGTLFLCWMGRRQRQAPVIAPPNLPSPPVPTRPLEQETPQGQSLRKLATAYQGRDAAGAREALLAWARLNWAANPPGNLSRLAERLPDPLRGYVLELDEALYSPVPRPWEQRPLVGLLSDLTREASAP